MATFFTADTHFGHGACRAFHHRPFDTTLNMDRAMVERWNAAVGREDIVWHLGDFAVNHPSPGELLDGLQGTKHLVVGNNDPAPIRALPWASVRELAEIDVDGHHAVLCHYALRTWPGQLKRAVQLHGHSHGRLKPMLRQFDVGVDVHGFRPVTLSEILA